MIEQHRHLEQTHDTAQTAELQQILNLSVPASRPLFKWGLHTNQLVCLTVKQQTNSPFIHYDASVNSDTLHFSHFFWVNLNSTCKYKHRNIIRNLKYRYSNQIHFHTVLLIRKNSTIHPYLKIMRDFEAGKWTERVNRPLECHLPLIWQSWLIRFVFVIFLLKGWIREIILMWCEVFYSTHELNETRGISRTRPPTSGVKRLNSLIQLGRVERGATTRKGPITFFSIIMAMWAMHWMVFPSPISSARIPLMPFSHSIWQHRGNNAGC